MKEIVLSLIVILSIAVVFTSCKDGKKENSSEINWTDEYFEEEENNKVEDLVNSMTIDEKIGQLMVIGIEGTVIDDEITDLIENKHVGGVILFRNNIESLSSVINLNNELKIINTNNKVPLFISVDEEGGLVSRTPSEFSKLPSSLYIVSFESGDMCYDIGSIIADELKIMGYNMDYAPVLDILSNPNNTVIGNRSYGINADIVSELAIKTMKGIQDNKVISVVKHFPGHGDTDVDSHYGLPSVNKSLEELKQLELLPFQKVIESGADAIMVAHILLSKIDSENPASMSKIVVNDILRSDLNFDGVVISDDMTMGAIMKNYDIGEAAVKAINAGVDIVLVCHGYDNENKVFDNIKEAVNQGIITEERLNDSVYRILLLKEKYNLSDNKIKDVDDISEINNRINNLFK